MHQQHFSNPNREATGADPIARVAVKQELITHAKKIKSVGSAVKKTVPHPLKQTGVAKLVDLL